MIPSREYAHLTQANGTYVLCLYMKIMMMIQAVDQNSEAYALKKKQWIGFTKFLHTV